MTKSYDIFISFKKSFDNQITEDYQIAKKLYLELKKIGFEVFFSEEEINNKDTSNFSLVIDEALNQAKVLIYVCTQLHFLDSPYVKYEWSSFSNEIKSGHKKGHILGLVKGIKYNLLPYALRAHELFKADEDYTKLFTHLDHLLSRNSIAPKIDYKAYRESLINNYKYRDQQTFERDELNQFIEFSLENETKLAVVSYEKYVDASILVYRITKEYSENPYHIYYVGDIQVFDFSILNSKPVEDDIIVIDKIYHIDQVSIIKNLTQRGYFIICAVPNEFNDIVTELQQIERSSQFHLQELNEEETSKYVRKVAKEIGLPLSGNLETILVIPTLKELRTPFMIRLILTSINNTSGYSDNDYNIIDIFEIIENFLSRQNSKVNEAVEYLFGIVLRKKINRFTHLETKNYESEIEYLYNQGIIKKNNFGFTITNQEYFLYRVSLAIMNEYGFGATIDTFKMFESAIPYYIYLMYLNTGLFDDTLISTLSDDLKEKMISLFMSESDPFELIVNNTKYRHNLDKLLSRFRKSGLYPLARFIIQTCENLGIESNDELDYISEKIMIHYYETGQVMDVNTHLFKSIYHIGYVYYCIDEPYKALERYQKAYEIMISSNHYNVSFMFDYIDALLDLGHNDQIKDLILETIEHCDNKTDEFIIRYNLTMGMIALDDLSFGLAEEYFKISLNTSLKVFNLKRIQISFGELGRLYIYQARYDEAIDYLNRNLEIAKSVSDFNGMAISSKLIALANLLQQNYIDAYRYFGYAENYAEQISNYWRLYKARLFLDLLDNNRKPKYERDISNARAMKSKVFQATALPLVALIQLKEDNYDQALRTLDEAIKLAIEVKNKRYQEVAQIIRNFITGELSKYSSTSLSYQTDLKHLIEQLINKAPLETSLPLPNFQYRSLTGERIDLKPMDVKYAEDIFEYTSSKTSTRYVMWERHKDIKDTLSFIDYVYDVKNAGYSMTWAILHKADNKVIGTIDLNYRDTYQNVEVGYILNSKYWHQGYASEALKMVIEFSRNYLPIKRLYGVVISENAASSKVLEKNGFKFDRHINNYHDIDEYSDKGGDIYILELK
ncbi:MAG: GNAT family N-acetyltransferase [Acholeplasma sp.]|jgi:RimJ/RimL family protein N-acetyltransferase|nr:GNAT family N-acetyltransferase [Acholeplasma sp.]